MLEKRGIGQGAKLKNSELGFDGCCFTLGNMATQVTLPIAPQIEHAIKAVSRHATLTGQLCSKHR